jgi:dihydropteroate synthase
MAAQWQALTAPRAALQLGARTIRLDQPQIMGIVNATPDSFSDGGQFADANMAAEAGARMSAEGAAIIDVGGESTRPGARAVWEGDEIERVVPVIRQLAQGGAAVSVDTRKAEVARAGIDAGATVVNDVSAGSDPAMFGVVRDAGCGMVLMRMRGDPKTMQDDPRYADVVAEVRAFLRERVDAAMRAGIDRACLCIDPGIGFGKTLEHNLALLHDVSALFDLGVPVVVGPSRKRFIGTLTGTEAGDRLEGTAGAVAWLAARGVHVVRVHDVKEIVRVVRVVDAIAHAGRAP